MASGEVNLPPGFVLDELPPGFVLDKKVDPTAELKDPVTGARAALDATASVASGMVAGPVSGLAGLAGTVLPGPPGQGAAWVQKTQQALTHEPSTPGSQAIVDAATLPFTKLAEQADKAGGAVTDVLGPGAGTAVNTGIQAIPLVLGRVGGLAKPSVQRILSRQQKAAADTASRGSVKAETWAAAQAEGYVVPPSAIKGSFVTNRLESAGGKAAIAQEASIRNQEVTNKIARREAGLQESDPLSEATLEAARNKIAAPYQEVASVSPRAAFALEKLKQARADAKAYWKHYGVSADPKSLKEAQRLDTKSQTLENLIDKEATRAGKPELVSQLRSARTALAKNYTVERALNVGSGDIDARMIGRMLDKGSPLTGGLETIGRFAEAFGPYAREATRVPTPGVSKTEALSAILLGVGGASATGGPGAALAALPLLSHPARALVLSRAMQPDIGLRPYSLGLRAAINLTDSGITDPAAIIAISEEQRKEIGH